MELRKDITEGREDFFYCEGSSAKPVYFWNRVLNEYPNILPKVKEVIMNAMVRQICKL